jgi:threonine/homoserine/homoserine lactone efflux protein
MVDPALYLGFVAAVTGLMLIPGPNVAFIVANSLSHGPKYGVLTVAGTSSAMVVQLIPTVLGLSALMAEASGLFAVLRWVGVAYLLFIAWRAWTTPADDLDAVAPAPRPGRIYARAFLISLTNPKTLLFYGAFFPQFVSPTLPVGPQFVVLSATFLTLAVLVDGGWALTAARARGLLVRMGRLRHRLTGGLLALAAAGLASVRTAAS